MRKARSVAWSSTAGFYQRSEDPFSDESAMPRNSPKDPAKDVVFLDYILSEKPLLGPFPKLDYLDHWVGSTSTLTSNLQRLNSRPFIGPSGSSREYPALRFRMHCETTLAAWISSASTKKPSRL
jgi:hypothetical protein